MLNTQEQLIDLSERIDLKETTVDEGVIKNVKLLGETSRNGRIYPLQTRLKAHSLIEGKMVNLNHGAKGVEARIGKLANIREGKGGTYGDFYFLTSHPMANPIMEAARRMPELYGFSINGKGKVVDKNGGKIVESIDSLDSIDLVTEPGTNSSLFESVDTDQIAKLQEELEVTKKELETYKVREHCRALLEENKCAVEQPLVESLMAMNSDEARANFIKYHRVKSTAKAPRSADVVRNEVKPIDYVKLLRGN